MSRGLSLLLSPVFTACLLLLSCPPSFAAKGASAAGSKQGKKHQPPPSGTLLGSSWGPAPDSKCCDKKGNNCCKTPGTCVYTSGGWIRSPECTCNQASDCRPNSIRDGYAQCQKLAAPLPKSYQGTLCTYSGSGCFANGTKVTMAEGTSRPIEDVRKGDRVHIPATPSSAASNAQIICVVTKSGIRTVQLPGASGLRITPWHPVRGDNGDWAFPANLIAATNPVVVSNETLNENLPLVYNLVLDSGHVVVVDGVEAVTLAHGFEDNDVVRHAYYGTDAVLKDLKSREGWENGWVHLG